MANLDFDLAGLLTGVSNRRQEAQSQEQAQGQPIPGSPNFRGMFAAQMANDISGGIGKLVRGGKPTKAQQLQEYMANIKRDDPEELKKLAKILRVSGENDRADKVDLRIQELLKAKTTTEVEGKAQAGFLKFIKENYPTYEALAESGAITPKNWTAFIKEEKGSSDSDFQFGRQREYKDPAGNLYLAAQKRDPNTGEVETLLSPVGDAPEKPTGRLQAIGGFGETAEERNASSIGTAGGSQAAEKFSDQVAAAPDIFATSSEGVYVADKMLNALENFSQGGFIPSTVKAMTDVIGMTPADIGDFEIKAQEMMIAKLSAFGANPTEGEARRAAALVASIKKTKGLNIRLINDYKQEMKRRASRAEYLLTEGANIQGYNDFSKNQYKSLGKKEVRNFGDLE